MGNTLAIPKDTDNKGWKYDYEFVMRINDYVFEKTENYPNRDQLEAVLEFLEEKKHITSI
jgi:TPP-dependent trihydroxycyclohexane-1,2-dione (THcHDO) dehydratase